MNKINNLLRGLSSKITDKELQDLIDYFNQAEKYISELEMINTQLSIKLNSKADTKDIEKQLDYALFMIRFPELFSKEEYYKKKNDILDVEINEIEKKILQLQN